MIKKARKHTKEWIESAIIAGSIILLVHLFVAEVYVVPSTSMESTVEAGDWVLISKLQHGARLPITPLGIPYTDKYIESVQLPYYRLPGFSSIERGDIIAFNFPVERHEPIDRRTPYLKRCIALPGDTVAIIDKAVFVNGKLVPSPLTVQHEYACTPDSLFAPEKLEELGIAEAVEHEGGEWFIHATQNMADSLVKLGILKEARGLRDKPGEVYDAVFPAHDQYKWSRDDFGPLYIPKSGDTLEISKNTIPLWKHILQLEGNEVEESFTYVKVNGEKAEKYVVRYNYYFVLGDSRHNSTDSRNWGVVPETHLIGKMVW